MRETLIATLAFLLFLLLIGIEGGWKSERLWTEKPMATVIETVETSPKPSARIEFEGGVSRHKPNPMPTPEPEPELLKVYAGKLTVTAYCPCEKCCGVWSDPDNPLTASGMPAVEGITVGADWGTLPPGTVIEIENIGQRIVQDKPAKWIVEKYDGLILDLYFDDHSAA